MSAPSYLCADCAKGWGGAKLYRPTDAAPPYWTPCHECGDPVGREVYAVYIKPRPQGERP